MANLHIVTPGQDAEEPPTWDAYWAAVHAIEKHRRRADTAEAEVSRLRIQLDAVTQTAENEAYWARVNGESAQGLADMVSDLRTRLLRYEQHP